jgi:hypothetical protein
MFGIAIVIMKAIWLANASCQILFIIVYIYIPKMPGSIKEDPGIFGINPTAMIPL